MVAKTSPWRLGNVQLVLIVTVVKLGIRKIHFTFKLNKYQQDKKYDTCWQITSRFQFLIILSECESLQWQPTLQVAGWRPVIKFWSPELNFWSHWRPRRRNFGPWESYMESKGQCTSCSGESTCLLPMWRRLRKKFPVRAKLLLALAKSVY